MDFIDQIKQISERIGKIKNQVSTEEATKNAFIMPMIQSLGYDVFNPLEVVPEFVADIGVKKGEKVDYAIMKDGSPVVLIECKHWAENLLKHDEQLFRYFTTSKAKFGILTNGIRYSFFTDLITPNIMDKEPFFSLDLENIKDNEVEELKKFHKSYFQIETITTTASELKYANLVKEIFSKELKEPSEKYIKFFMNQVFEGNATEKNVSYFSGIVRKSVQQVINDQITERLKNALDQQKAMHENGGEVENSALKDNMDNSKIVTTQEEVEGFHIVKAILRNKIPVNRIYCRDQQTYFGILLDDNNRKPICRLYFNTAKKTLAVLDEMKKETKIEILSLDDIYQYADLLEKTALSYEKSTS